jgi:predicted ribosomally synthesized peptide with nif11-like leader
LALLGQLEVLLSTSLLSGKTLDWQLHYFHFKLIFTEVLNMSVEAVNQFLQKVTEDPQLQEELAKALEADNDRQAAADLAAKHGYQFTPDELWAEIQNRQSEFEQQSTGELSEDELEAVAGGFCTPIIGAGIGAAGAITGAVINKAKW